MRIGITYDLKSGGQAHGLQPVGLPDDWQEEYDSPATIEAIAAVLRHLDHDVCKLGDGRELLTHLLADPPDFVFNIAEGQGVGRSREARVPAVLEMLGIPYTGSDPLTLAVTLDKECAKRLVQTAGVRTPRFIVVAPTERLPSSSDLAAQLDAQRLGFPVIVKPAWEGSSKGIRKKSLVDSLPPLAEVIASLRQDHAQPVLVEEYIEGDELTVGVLGNAPPQVVGIMRVLPRTATQRFIYSLEVKRDWERQVRYECPAQLSASATERVCQAALAAYGVLGCRDVARVDFRLRDGVPYFLEVNPLPGLNPESGDLVLLSKLVSWTYERLIATILDSAQQRQPQNR